VTLDRLAFYDYRAEHWVHLRITDPDRYLQRPGRVADVHHGAVAV
jgi:hypothetical protein